MEKIQVGGVYRTRGGQIVRIDRKRSDAVRFPYAGRLWLPTRDRTPECCDALGWTLVEFLWTSQGWYDTQAQGHQMSLKEPIC